MGHGDGEDQAETLVTGGIRPHDRGGRFEPGKRVELIEGQILAMTPQMSRSAGTV
jgi:hypothetical protein